ncbi:hypothetical protein BDK51DRAFT_41890 [Blyttiomyces helicus]|uniref:Uncharacterized protein n=1 Tax=Blyttiomyces helicus TaxID=388810 RepID=A0A4P9W5N4_9FUNG|nr:hypothetical protein BDK51DRAFT_41890 [Blyttiomyces helicus]|eukprot:RKO87574.1 hypothetical protein BDK51DRAFT_41890 [Blyttiomyces helicus]
MDTGKEKDAAVHIIDAGDRSGPERSSLGSESLRRFSERCRRNPHGLATAHPRFANTRLSLSPLPLSANELVHFLPKPETSKLRAHLRLPHPQNSNSHPPNNYSKSNTSSLWRREVTGGACIVGTGSARTSVFQVATLALTRKTIATTRGPSLTGRWGGTPPRVPFSALEFTGTVGLRRCQESKHYRAPRRSAGPPLYIPRHFSPPFLAAINSILILAFAKIQQGNQYPQQNQGPPPPSLPPRHQFPTPYQQQQQQQHHPPQPPQGYGPSTSVQKLERDLAAERAERAALEDREMTLTSSLSLLENQVRHLKLSSAEEQENAQTRIGTLESQLAQAALETNALQERIRVIPSLQQRLQAELAARTNAEAALAAAKESGAALGVKLQALEAEKRRLEETVAGAAREKEALEARLSTTAATIKDLQMEKESLQLSLTTAETEKRRLETAAATFPATVAELEHKAVLQKDEKERISRRVLELEAVVDSLKRAALASQERERRVPALEADLRASQEAVLNLGRTKAELEASLEALRAESAAATDRDSRVPALEAELSASKEAVIALGRTKAELDAALEAKTKEHALTSSKLASEIAARDSGNAPLLAELETLRAAQAAHEEAVAALKAEHAKETDALGERLVFETAALNERNQTDARELSEKSRAEIETLAARVAAENAEKQALAQALYRMQMEYERPPSPVIFTGPPPTDPLPMPRGTDPELWAFYTSVDAYQLKVINSAQLTTAISHDIHIY